jgi:hypothetical protein
MLQPSRLLAVEKRNCTPSFGDWGGIEFAQQECVCATRLLSESD